MYIEFDVSLLRFKYPAMHKTYLLKPGTSQQPEISRMSRKDQKPAKTAHKKLINDQKRPKISK